MTDEQEKDDTEDKIVTTSRRLKTASASRIYGAAGESEEQKDS
jgi:hypothetical protein